MPAAAPEHTARRERQTAPPSLVRPASVAPSHREGELLDGRGATPRPFRASSPHNESDRDQTYARSLHGGAVPADQVARTTIAAAGTHPRLHLAVREQQVADMIRPGPARSRASAERMPEPGRDRASRSLRHSSEEIYVQVSRHARHGPLTFPGSSEEIVRNADEPPTRGEGAEPTGPRSRSAVPAPRQSQYQHHGSPKGRGQRQVAGLRRSSTFRRTCSGP